MLASSKNSSNSEILMSNHCFCSFFFNALALTPVERVRSQWDSTQHGVEARLHQLDNMIGHSNQWEERRKEVKALIGHSEGRFHNLLQQSGRDPLTKQLADNKVRENLTAKLCPVYPCCLFFFPRRETLQTKLFKVLEVLDIAGQGEDERITSLQYHFEPNNIRSSRPSIILI